jgi:hypothetical protein
LASEAAVGANKPDVGKGGREAETDDTPAAAAVVAAFFNDGVFGREPGVADGVGSLAALLVAVERGRVDGALLIPVPFDGVRGVGVFERVTRLAVVAVTVDGRAAGDDVDFDGDPGVLAGLRGTVDGRDVEADTRGLIVSVAVGVGAGTGTRTGTIGTGTSCAMMGSSSTVDGIASGTAAESEFEVDASDMDTRSGGAPSSETGGTNVVVVVLVVPRNVADAAGGLELVLVPFALPFVLTGGHSRAMRCSSFTASPVLLEVALAARDGGPDELGWRFCCCSKRPMRFATD